MIVSACAYAEKDRRLGNRLMAVCRGEGREGASIAFGCPSECCGMAASTQKSLAVCEALSWERQGFKRLHPSTTCRR